MTRRRRTRVWGIVLGAVLVAAAAITVWQLTSRPASAEDAALSYLHALESGDPEAVASTGADVTDDALTAFSAADELIDDAAVDGLETHDGATTAKVSFRLDGERHSATLTMTPHDGGWRIEPAALGGLDVSPSTGSFVAIGDAAFAVGEPIALLPAAYTIVAAPAELLDGTADVVVLPEETAAVDLDVTLRPAATAAAQSALDEHLTRCTAEGGDQPEGCGIRIPWGTEFRTVSDVSYRVESFPALALTATGFTASDGVLVATVTGTGQDGADRTTTYRTNAWRVRGGTAFTETGVRVEVW